MVAPGLGQVMHWLATGERRKTGPEKTPCCWPITDMLAHYDIKTGVNMFRKHIGWYTHGLHGAAAFRNKANFMDNPADVKAALHESTCRLLA
jgi:tRNA-dihydrouridine synthase B